MFSINGMGEVGVKWDVCMRVMFYLCFFFSSFLYKKRANFLSIYNKLKMICHSKSVFTYWPDIPLKMLVIKSEKKKKFHTKDLETLKFSSHDYVYIY